MSEPAIRPRRTYLAALILGLLAAAALSIDLPVSRLVLRQHGSSAFESLLDVLGLFEPFAHAVGAAVIVLAVLVLDAGRRRAALRLAACTFGSGLLSDVVKLTVGRLRPKHVADTATVWETFQGWLPLSHDLKLATERAIQSFPSGHAATAAGLAVGLTWLYPRGRWLFLALAVIASLQRVAAAAHFPSDALAGAALGCLVGAVCTDPRLLGRWFGRFEHAAARP